MNAPTRAELRRHLVETRIAGPVATPRENNLANYARLADRDPGYTFGLRLAAPWSSGDILALMAKAVGVHPDPAYAEGQDNIDPDRTLDRLEAAGARLREAARARQRVLIATGHPAGLLAVHAEVARVLAAAGAALLTPAAGQYDVNSAGRRRQIRYVGGVAMVSAGGGLNHTHSPSPMELMLAALEREGLDPPDLVVADHGYAGAAGAAGIEVIGFADSNDPALFVGEAEGRIAVAVPLDDNVVPHLYAPLTDYLLQAMR